MKSTLPNPCLNQSLLIFACSHFYTHEFGWVSASSPIREWEKKSVSYHYDHGSVSSLLSAGTFPKGELSSRAGYSSSKLPSCLQAAKRTTLVNSSHEINYLQQAVRTADLKAFLILALTGFYKVHAFVCFSIPAFTACLTDQAMASRRAISLALDCSLKTAISFGTENIQRYFLRSELPTSVCLRQTFHPFKNSQFSTIVRPHDSLHL